MSTRSSRPSRKPLSPKIIQARILVTVLAVALVVALILPWLATASLR
jgi:hypothetical protein